MEDSVLVLVKQMVNINEADTSFDLDLITYINSSFSALTQIGLGPSTGFFVSGKDDKWSSFTAPGHHLSLVKTYICLKVRMSFDPPGTGFHKDALEKEITEIYNRLSLFREVEKDE